MCPVLVTKAKKENKSELGKAVLPDGPHFLLCCRNNWRPFWLDQGRGDRSGRKSERWRGKITEGLVGFCSQCDGKSKESFQQAGGMTLLV